LTQGTVPLRKNQVRRKSQGEGSQAETPPLLGSTPDQGKISNQKSFSEKDRWESTGWQNGLKTNPCVEPILSDSKKNPGCDIIKRRRKSNLSQSLLGSLGDLPPRRRGD